MKFIGNRNEQTKINLIEAFRTEFQFLLFVKNTDRKNLNFVLCK